MEIPYTPPAHQLTAFNCPRCHAYAKQEWITSTIFGTATDFDMSSCGHCKKSSYWYQKRMIDPDVAGVSPPNADLDDDIQIDYKEAASILSKSPRGAAALLRLAIEKLCQQLGDPKKNLNGNIALLVERGLDKRIQKALDSVRVIGGQAIHPGVLDLRDDIPTATTLFFLVNEIAEEMITKPKEIDEFYKKMPQTKRDAIKKRDSSGVSKKGPSKS